MRKWLVLAGLMACGVVIFGARTPLSDGDLAHLWLDASNGDQQAQLRLAQQFADRRSVLWSPVEAVPLFRSLAERGNAKAQFGLGLLYLRGEGVPADTAEAAKWLQKAAEFGLVGAQFSLGELYANSHDPDRAVKWLEAAMEQGHPEARARLDALRAKGLETKGDPLEANRTGAEKTGGPAALGSDQHGAGSPEPGEDPADTVRWSLLLSGLRGTDAFLVRGFMLENSIVVNRDLAAAAASYRKAAELGDARAQFHLGLMYAEGRGVTKDIDEACAWLNRAAANGSADALTALASLKATLPSRPAAAAAKPVGEPPAFVGGK